MQIWKKTLLMMALGLGLSGCAPATNTPALATTATPFPSPTPFPTNTPLPADLGLPLVDVSGQEISIWYVWNAPDTDPFAEMITKFNQENTGGVIASGENHYSYDALNAALLENLNIAPEKVPNVVLGYSYQYLAWHAFGDRLVDLTPYLADSRLSAGNGLGEILALYQAQDIYGEQRLGIPAWRSAQVLFYNQSWAQELGFSGPPTSPETFRTQACAAANSGAGGWLRDYSSPTILSWLAGAGEQPTTDIGDYNFTSSAMHAVFEFLYQLEADGCVRSADDFYPEYAFANRDVLFYSASTASVPYHEKAMVAVGNGDNWLILPYVGNAASAVNVYGPSWMVLDRDAAGNQAGWAFLNFWTQRETQTEWAGMTDTLSLFERDFDTLQAEPNLHSWGTVRWALRDAAHELYSFGFEAIDIPRLLAQLQATAQELQSK